MGKNKRNIFRRSSKLRLSFSSIKTAGSEKSNGSNLLPSNGELSQPIEKEPKKNEKTFNQTNPEKLESIEATNSNIRNATKLDRKKMKEKAKQISENNRSLKRRKKKNVVKQILNGFQQPKDISNGPQEETENHESLSSQQVSYSKEPIHRPSSRHLLRDVQPGGFRNNKDQHSHGQDVMKEYQDHDGVKDTRKMAPEEIYESRKLLIRQMQGMIAKKEHKSSRQNKAKGENSHRRPTDEIVSEYDSWSDLEENFAKGFDFDLHNLYLTIF